jgi:hypothetical protein
MKPHKVVFGFCISDCTSWNTNAAQAVTIMSDLKVYNSSQYPCNGGASSGLQRMILEGHGVILSLQK